MSLDLNKQIKISDTKYRGLLLNYQFCNKTVKDGSKKTNQFYATFTIFTTGSRFFFGNETVSVKSQRITVYFNFILNFSVKTLRWSIS